MPWWGEIYSHIATSIAQGKKLIREMTPWTAFIKRTNNQLNITQIYRSYRESESKKNKKTRIKHFKMA